MARRLAAAARAAVACALLAACLPVSHVLAADIVPHKIVSVDGEPKSRKLSVRIDTRMTEKAIKDLAVGIAAKHKPGEAIATIAFYLPGHELTQAPWANARISGVNAEVSVMGLRAEEETAFRAEAETDTRDVVGVWLTSPPALPGKLTILRAQKGCFIAEWHLRSGQKTTDEVTMARVSRGYRYDVVGGDGAYYLATWSGPLQLGDATRTIALAEKLVIDKKPIAASKALNAIAPAQPVAAGASTATQGTPAAGPASATLATADPAKAAPRSRRKSVAKRKTGSSVADLMGGSLTR